MEDYNNDKNCLEPVAVLGVGGFLATIIITIIILFSIGMNIGGDSYLKFLLILLVISIIAMVVGLILNALDSVDEKDKHVANINQFQKEYDEYVDRLGLVKSDIQVTLIEIGKYSFEVKIPQYLWICNNYIKLFPKAEYYKNNLTSSESKPDVSELKLKSISIDSILYFEEMGELRKYTTVSGGGTSLKGALLGYVIADDLGAIIGSREPIKTAVVSEDDRRVELIYKNENGDIENLEFTYDAYSALKKMIPSKELKRIANLKVAEKKEDFCTIKSQDLKTAKDKLKQLKEMKKEGLITEEEFLEQKKKILDAF